MTIEFRYREEEKPFKVINIPFLINGNRICKSTGKIHLRRVK
jgi:hypothetical protein